MNRSVIAPSLPAASRWRGIGIVVCAGFGALWAVYALAPLTPAALRYAAALLPALPLATAGLQRARKAVAGSPLDRHRFRHRRRGFLLVLALEVLAMNAVAAVLSACHLRLYLMPSLAIIVGLHFLPLARLLQTPRYRLATVWLTGSGLFAVLALRAGRPHAPVLALAQGTCTLSLWTVGWMSVRAGGGQRKLA